MSASKKTLIIFFLISDNFQALWKQIPDAYELCSIDDDSFKVRINRDKGNTDCGDLCESVGQKCLGGWDDDDNLQCPTESQYGTNDASKINCGNNNHDTFVCQCTNGKL